MSEFDEVVFNLFIMHFRYSNYYGYVKDISEKLYKENIKTNEFINLKECFPENEYCYNELCIALSNYNWIKE
jgi:hypothetical protein